MKSAKLMHVPLEHWPASSPRTARPSMYTLWLLSSKRRPPPHWVLGRQLPSAGQECPPILLKEQLGISSFACHPLGRVLHDFWSPPAARHAFRPSAAHCTRFPPLASHLSFSLL